MYTDKEKERKPSLLSKAVVIAAGGFAIKKMTRGSRMYDELDKFIGSVGEAASHTVKTFGRTKRVDMTYDMISSTLKKSFGKEDSIYKKSMEKIPELNIRTSFNGGMKGIKSYIEQKNSLNELAGILADSKRSSLAITHVSKKMKNANKEVLKQMKILIDDALSEQGKFFDINTDTDEITVIEEALDKRLKGSSIEKEKDILKEALEFAVSKNKDIEKEAFSKAEDINKINLSKIKDEIIRMYGKESDSFANRVQDNAATVRDLLEAKKAGTVKISGEINSESDNAIINTLEKLVKEDEDFFDVVLDNALIKKREIDPAHTNRGVFAIHSLSNLRKFADDAIDGSADTIFGKLFHTRSFYSTSKSPFAYHIREGSYDAVIAKHLGSDSGIVTSNVFKIGERFWKEENSTFTEIETLRNAKLMSGDHGSLQVILNKMTGNVSEKYHNNNFQKRFDIGTIPKQENNIFSNIFSKLNKESNWVRHKIDRLFNFSDEGLMDSLDTVTEINKLFNTNMRAPSMRALEGLKSVTKNNKANKILEMITNDENLAEQLINSGLSFQNDNLNLLIRQYEKGDRTVDSFLQIGKGNKLKGANILKFDELLRREATREVLLKEAGRYDLETLQGFKVLDSKIKDMDISNADKKHLNELSAWTILQHSTGTYSKYTRRAIDTKLKAEQMLRIKTVLNSSSQNAQSDDFLNNLKSGISDFVKENSDFTDSVFEKDYTLKQSFRNNEYVAVNESIGLKQILSLNKGIMDAAKQLVAGRGNEELISQSTLVAYHMINRLATPFEEIGLGISSENATNVLNLLKNSGIKRIIPAIGIGMGLTYLNDEAQMMTGTSFTGAMLNTKARMELGVKSITGAVGLDTVFEAGRDYNPISEYLFGDEYRNYDEHLEYLENGYDPVRKGRYWSFGSSSEFRGGKISYWRPNALRREHSNYYDISMYGSTQNKWKHSWMPNLRNPIAPITKLANPYWLENFNYNERPYPVSGKMCGEGAPWSAPLNATVGRILKPQKRMHQEHLQGTMVDVRTIVAEENKRIMDKAAENRIVRVDQSGFSNMTFAPESMPSMGEAVYDISKTSWGELQGAFKGQDYADNLSKFEQMQMTDEGAVYGGNPVKGTGTFSLSSGYSAFEEGNIAGAGSYAVAESDSLFSNMISNVTSRLVTSGAVGHSEGSIMIEGLNNQIMANAEAKQDGAIYESGREASNPIFEHKKKLEREFFANENITNIGSKSEYVREIGRSLKQTSGIYGFIWDFASGNQNQGYRLAQAHDMNSFSRRFWDASVGGMGGGVMEISRRLFPSTDKSITNINPIRNTMPLWMPERFLTGNPYDLLPDGEARLPGRGYEALNKLNSDQYGKYGSIDRFKILADVAPMGEEYKIWKKIATQEAKSPQQKEMISQINKRAEDQNKEHDFYEYKFLSRDLKTEKAVISEVGNTGDFKVRGSDEQFRLAGIKVMNDMEGNSQVHNYLKPGMTVEIGYEDNEFRNKNKAGEITAVAFNSTGSVTRNMIEEGAATENDRKETLADEYFKLSKGNITAGHVFEAIGHAQIPYLHNKFLRIDSPLESYRKEQVYGSPFSTWDSPIDGFVKPAFQNAFAQGPISQAVGLGTFALSEYARTTNWGKAQKMAAHTLFAFTNPAAFAGGMIGAIPRLGISTGAAKYINSRTGAAIGATVGAIGYGMANLENPILSAGNFATAGFFAAKQLKIDKLAQRNDVFKGIGRLLNTDVIEGKHGAIIGAAVGVGLSALKNPEFSLNKLNERYIPEDTEKKWEIEEYYDRLEYLKYNNLYKQAARKAKIKEGVDIEKQINKFEYAREDNDDRIQKIYKQIEDAETIVNDSLRESTINILNGKLANLITQEQLFSGGEYTKSAIAYKKAMDSTIYGLTKFSSVGDVLRAIPKYDRDYFLEFAKEKDPGERKKILSHVSPYKRKALEVLWRESEVEKVESNNDYFKGMHLPNLFWSGWRPNVDLEDVKIKTIENEGMLLSDFGMYDSNKNNPSYQAAPEIQNINATASPLAIKRDVVGMLAGIDLQGMEVSVEPSQAKGINFVTNIIRTGVYNVQEQVSSIFESEI